MVNFPLVSILIPCYNHSEYVGECLNSILTDNYPNKEIVIIDDGSVDSSSRKISDWIHVHKNSIYIKFKSTENRGLTRTLNELIRLSKGEFVAILASDDKLNETGIRDRVNYLLEFTSKMVVFGDSQLINERSEVIFESAFQRNKGNLSDFDTDEGMFNALVLKGWPSPGPVTMIKREYYTKFGYYPEDLIMEDQYFYLTAIANSLLGYLHKPVALYRVHSVSLSQNPKRQKRILRDLAKSYFRRMNLFGPKQSKVLLTRGIKTFIKSFII